jgi:hypothetical protein
VKSFIGYSIGFKRQSVQVSVQVQNQVSVSKEKVPVKI